MNNNQRDFFTFRGSSATVELAQEERRQATRYPLRLKTCVVSVDQKEVKVVGLSQSGAVRLIDRLERDGLVARGAGEDGRVTAISLTAAGRTAARTIESSRLESLEAALAPLTRQEMEAFTELAGKLLVGLMREPGATRWMCRLCGLSACGRPDGNCPLEREARVRYG